MILIDYSQFFIMTAISNIELLENSVKHLVLHYIKEHLIKFSKKFSKNLVVVCDNRDYWRRDIFPNYKALRKSNREKSGIDWGVLYSYMDSVKNDLINYFPYKVIEVHKCEADDIIAVLVNEYVDKEKILIVSSDNDFAQLHRHKNVYQYSSLKDKFLTFDKPLHSLKEKIIRGDRGDGIPSILSDDNVFVDGIRQKPLKKVKVDEWILQKPEEFCTGTMLRNYHRNRQLIDLSMIPKDYCEKIIDTYTNININNRELISEYLKKNAFNNLLEDVENF